ASPTSLTTSLSTSESAIFLSPNPGQQHLPPGLAHRLDLVRSNGRFSFFAVVLIPQPFALDRYRLQRPAHFELRRNLHQITLHRRVLFEMPLPDQKLPVRHPLPKLADRVPADLARYS